MSSAGVTQAGCGVSITTGSNSTVSFAVQMAKARQDKAYGSMDRWNCQKDQHQLKSWITKDRLQNARQSYITQAWPKRHTLFQSNADFDKFISIFAKEVQSIDEILENLNNYLNHNKNLFDKNHSYAIFHIIYIFQNLATKLLQLMTEFFYSESAITSKRPSEINEAIKSYSAVFDLGRSKLPEAQEKQRVLNLQLTMQGKFVACPITCFQSVMEAIAKKQHTLQTK
jgi:hypothetical protein